MQNNDNQRNVMLS